MKVDSAMLEQMRQNPATAVQGDKVVCLECGLLVCRLTRSPKCHARYTHNLDATAYLAKWPGAPLLSDEAKQEELDKHYALIKANRPAINKQRRARYAKICEIAESNPTSPEAAKLKKEHDRSSASWADKYWGDGPADKKAEAFRKSESGRRHERHEDNQEQENKQGRNRYHDNLPVSRAKSREKQANMRKLARAARARGITAGTMKRGRRRDAEQDKRYFTIGAQVENEIPANRKKDKQSIVTARQLVCDRTRLQYDVVAKYHKQYRLAAGLRLAQLKA